MIKLFNKAIFSVLLLGMAFAAQAAVDVTVGTATGAQGDSITIPVTIAGDALSVGGQFDISFDAAVVSVGAPAIVNAFSMVPSSIATSVPSPGVLRVVISPPIVNPLPPIPDGSFVINFDIDAAAAAGLSPLALSNVQFSDDAAANVPNGTLTDGSVTVSAGPLPGVSIVGTTPAAEPATNGVFTVSRTGSTVGALTVALSAATGSATSGADYTALPVSVIIPDGAADVTIDLIVTDDAAVEGTETVTLDIAADAAYDIVTGSATLDIQDDDALPEVSVTATVAAAAEPATPGEFTFTCTAGNVASVTIGFAITGSATSGTDYAALAPVTVNCPGSAPVPVTVIDDADIEGSESVIVTITADATFTVGAPSSATVNIADDDVAPEVTITANDPNAEERDGTLDNGQFTISCTAGTVASVSVAFGVTGSATPGTDYTAITSPVTVACPGSTVIDVTVLDDGDDNELGETVSINLSAGANYTLGASSGALVSIVGNLTTPKVIPTLGAWALILMALSLMFIAVPMVRTRQS